MSWEDQGRQYHMWFGHGTAPAKGEASEMERNDLFGPGNFGPRIDAIAHSARAHMLPADRRRSAAAFDPQRLGNLRTRSHILMAGRAWHSRHRPMEQTGRAGAYHKPSKPK
jgi:hypothetical protein